MLWIRTRDYLKIGLSDIEQLMFPIEYDFYSIDPLMGGNTRSWNS